MQHIDYVIIDSLKATPGNPKDHDIPGIARSIATLGYAEPILEDGRTGRVIAGHGRIEALTHLRDHPNILAEARALADDPTQGPPRGIKEGPNGEWMMPVVKGWESANDDEATTYLIASNRWVEMGGWDNTALTSLLASLNNHGGGLMEVAGYTPEDLDRLISAQAIPDLADFKSPDEGDDDYGDGSGGGRPVECPACGHTFTP